MSEKGLIKEGMYYGTIQDYGLTENKNGDVSAIVKVDFEATYENGQKGQQTLTWFGGFKTEKGAAYTMKTLHDLGYPSDDPRGLASGRDSKMLKLGDEVKITVEHNTYEGKTSSRIKYLNSSGKFKSASPKALSSLDWVAGAVKKNKTDGDPGPSDDDMPGFLK